MQFEVASTDLQRLGKELKRSGKKDLQKETLKRMRAPVQKLVPDVRSAVRALPGSSTGERSARSLAERPRSLRDAVARGVQVKSSLSGKYVGIRIRVDPRHLPRGSKALPKYLEGTKRPWRHPTFGRRDNPKDWQQQRPHPYFYPTIHAHIPAIKAQIAEIVQEITKKITEGGQ